ncbi:energy-coupling factor ABC transporter ATP-binding protein [Virgibacillus sp. W0430]|uniref:energy-coupling factor ABC transporter ATP-binding protein n=1 Tax=Virgibacillus sp. W0430 TaxID=3391580 RepID=UPI003F45D69D
MKPIIEVSNLVYRYKRGKQALNDVNLKIYDSELISIVGQNGSGKTTLVKHFNGLLKPTEGVVKIEQESTAEKSVGYLSGKVGYVFQNPNHQFFTKTVEEELMTGPKNFKLSHKETKENLDYVIELLRIDDILKEHPMNLDYTSKKIVSIASVLTFNPKVFIMDEPTGGLDEVGRQLLIKTMNLLHKQGKTVIIISHDMDFVAENSNRIIVMANGNILRDGDGTSVFNDNDSLQKAWIEPPQITQLGKRLNFQEEVFVSVDQFVNSFTNKKEDAQSG